MLIDVETRSFLMDTLDLTGSEMAILQAVGKLEHGHSTITMRRDRFGVVVTEYRRGCFYQEFKF